MIQLNLYVTPLAASLFECVLTKEGVYASEEQDFVNCGFFDQDDPGSD